MSGSIAEEVRRRNEVAASGQITHALKGALRAALVELAELKGVDHLDGFLARRLDTVESARADRPWEPPALTAARHREADAVEAVLRGIVRDAREVL